MQAIYETSGDLIADRRFEWARDHAGRGDLTAAAELLEQSLEIAPGYASAWFVLGEIRAQLGDRLGAEQAFRRTLALDSQDRRGARLQLMRISAEPAGEMPAAYVRALFDGYASTFDRTLVDRLDYCGPGLLFHAVASSGRPMRFTNALDLGCGTGLAAGAFRAHCDRLVGVDLSPGMIAKAQVKGFYDRLVVGDVSAFLCEEAATGARYDLVIAADVFVYMRELAPVLAAIADVMSERALLAFSVETPVGNDADDAVILRETLRYAHGRAHVIAALAAAGLVTVGLETAALRIEKGEPVSGLVVVAQRKIP
ncbi:MAG: methyltransferase [Pseudolabrys sp.]